VSDRVSETILLCEDDPQEQMVRQYLKRCGARTQEPSLRVRNASNEVHGGNVGWVLREFPYELKVCRKRHATNAKTQLIVVIDADEKSVAERRGHDCRHRSDRCLDTQTAHRDMDWVGAG
jgi:hypothetical protein